MRHLLLFLPIVLFSTVLLAQKEQAADRTLVYKQIDTVELKLLVYEPSGDKPEAGHPAIVFFFGGGWNGGSTSQFSTHAAHFAQRGMYGILVEYRVKSRHGTTPFEAVQDAKSAMRYVRAHAAEWGINPDQIVAAGGSAGGHLAAACATLPGLDEPTEDLSVSPKPNALVLFNPVYDNGPEGYGHERIGDRYPEFSPLHNLKTGTPPTLVLFGTEDPLVPVSTISRYQATMDSVGSRCETILYLGQKHGFFNTRFPFYYQQTLQAADIFLTDLGFLKVE